MRPECRFFAHRDQLVNGASMRWVFGFLFGVVGAVICLLVFGDSSIGGELGTRIKVGAIAMGVVIAAPVGFIIGSLLDAVVSPAPQKPKKTIAHFSPQISGSQCSVCGEHILLVTDGQYCEHCRSVFHIACGGNEACPSCEVSHVEVRSKNSSD